MEEIRIPRGDLDERLKRLHRDGLTFVSVRASDKDDPESDWLITVEPRLEIRS